MGPDPATSRLDEAPVTDVAFDKTFACDDSLQRADGTQRTGARCIVAREYCYEASGGAAMSHGAQCRSLPASIATCDALAASIGAGASCTGAEATGFRVHFAYP